MRYFVWRLVLYMPIHSVLYAVCKSARNMVNLCCYVRQISKFLSEGKEMIILLKYSWNSFVTAKRIRDTTVQRTHVETGCIPLWIYTSPILLLRITKFATVTPTPLNPNSRRTVLKSTKCFTRSDGGQRQAIILSPSSVITPMYREQANNGHILRKH
jgi:hypothetical protein